MVTDFQERARRLRNAVEPVAAGVYFAPEAHAAYQALGFAGSPISQDGVARPDLKVRDWKEMNRQLFSALKLEKFATFVVLSIAILVASFCIICTLLLMVTEKSKEIAIMKAMGASDEGILRLFMTEGMFIGGVGTVFGVVTGYTAMKKIGKRRSQSALAYHLLPTSRASHWLARSASYSPFIPTI